MCSRRSNRLRLPVTGPEVGFLCAPLECFLATEGSEIIEIAQAREKAAKGEAFDLDDVLAEVDGIVKGAAA